MRRDVYLRPSAGRDIDAITDYTIATWGSAKARQYVTELRRAIEQLSTSAMQHPPQADLLPALRKMRSGNHLVFFIADDRTVDVIRVLHERMNVSDHLG